MRLEHCASGSLVSPFSGLDVLPLGAVRAPGAWIFCHWSRIFCAPQAWMFGPWACMFCCWSQISRYYKYCLNFASLGLNFLSLCLGFVSRPMIFRAWAPTFSPCIWIFYTWARIFWPWTSDCAPKCTQRHSQMLPVPRTGCLRCPSAPQEPPGVKTNVFLMFCY